MEVNALLAEVDKIANNTRFNDVKVLDGTYDQTIRAGNTNAETIRVNVGSLKTADNAKLSQYAVEKAINKTAASYATNTTTLDLEAVTSAKVEIDLVSLAHASFKEVFKGDSLGTFELDGAATAAGRVDNASFDIDAKTGKLTSNIALTTTSDLTTTDSEHKIAIKYTPRADGATV